MPLHSSVRTTGMKPLSMLASVLSVKTFSHVDTIPRACTQDRIKTAHIIQSVQTACTPATRKVQRVLDYEHSS